MLRFLNFIFVCFLFHVNINCEDFHEKWIVVTSINYPTNAVKKLASFPDWKLVVVGDKNTPKDWFLENAIFLSVEDQKKLGFEIANLLPYNHYSRKNIGYLYAVSHGAKVIYDTDDDNEPIDSIITFSELDNVIELGSKRRVVNVYAYFGLSHLWPRGYPLNDIPYSREYTINELSSKPPISVIQGMVNKDPDVDAIFRLTQGHESYFEYQSPCVLQSQIFCPFNTQNTLFNQDAFWGLYIPSTTPFRVCDIWRGYVVQRLLWDLNLSVCFTGPSAIQERNVHDLFKDFCDEQELYLQAGSLLDYLLKWEDKDDSIQRKYSNLMNLLIQGKFFKEKEAEYLDAWFRDLANINYNFP